MTRYPEHAAPAMWICKLLYGKHLANRSPHFAPESAPEIQKRFMLNCLNQLLPDSENRSRLVIAGGLVSCSAGNQVINEVATGLAISTAFGRKG